MERLTGIALVLLMVAVSLDAKSRGIKCRTCGLKTEWYPGDVMNGTLHGEIEKALKDVAEAGGILETRTVALGIASVSGRLQNPRWVLLDGYADSTMPFTIRAGQTGLLLFTKSPIGIEGVYGVLTYDIADSEFKVAVMFNTPWNQLTNPNMYNYKVFSKTTPVDKDMVQHMYKYAGPWEAQGYEERTEYGVHMYGTMSSNTHSRLIMWVDTSGLDIRLGPSRHAECDYKLLAGDRCWRECTPTGWCWTNTKCATDADCDGSSLFCHLSCKKAYTN